MPQTSLLLPQAPTPLPTLVVAVVAAVAIIAASLLVIGSAPDTTVAKRQPAGTLVACNAIPGGLQCR